MEICRNGEMYMYYVSMHEWIVKNVQKKTQSKFEFQAQLGVPQNISYNILATLKGNSHFRYKSPL